MPESTEAERGLLASISYPALHPGAAKVAEEADAILKESGGHGRFFLTAHRGWTKSSFALRRILLFVKNTGMPAAWYAPTLKPITDAWENLFKKALGAENFDRWMNKSEMILRIPNCGSIHFYSLVEPSNAAGPTYPFCVIDESGSLADKVYQSVISKILLKAQISYGYSELWCIGTPNREGNPKNDFWRNLTRALEGKMKNGRGWHIPVPAKVHGDTLRPAPSPYAHPDYTFEVISEDFADADRPKAWRIEMLCEFIADDGGQFEQDAIEAQCVLEYEVKQVPIADTSLYARGRSVGEEYEGEFFEVCVRRGYKPSAQSYFQLACDIGVTNDRTAIGVLDRSTMELVYFHHFLPFGRDRWFLVKEAIAMAARRFEDRFLVDASGAGSHIPEEMRQEYGITVEPFIWGVNKEPVLNYTSSLLEGGQLWLMAHDEIKSQLDMMQRTARASGKGYAIAAAKGGHDDIPSMLGLLTHEVIPNLPKDGRPGVQEEDYWSVGATAPSMYHDDGSVVVIDTYDMDLEGYGNGYGFLTEVAG